MKCSKTYYGGTYFTLSDLENSSINHEVELEYYSLEKRIHNKSNVSSTYGIEIVKKEYLENTTKVERRNVEYVTKDKEQAETILELLKRNKVTPMSLDDIVYDLVKITE